MATTFTPITHTVLPLGAIARAHIRQLNYQGLARTRRMNIGAWSSTEMKVRAKRTRTEVQVEIFGL